MPRTIRKSFDTTGSRFATIDTDARNPDSCEGQLATRVDVTIADSGRIAIIVDGEEGAAVSLSLCPAIVRDIVAAWVCQLNMPDAR